jgi:hypothetical protein
MVRPRTRQLMGGRKSIWPGNDSLASFGDRCGVPALEIPLMARGCGSLAYLARMILHSQTHRPDIPQVLDTVLDTSPVVAGGSKG